VSLFEMLGANSDFDGFEEFEMGQFGEGGGFAAGALSRLFSGGCDDCGVRDEVIPTAPVASPFTPQAPPKIPGGDPIIIREEARPDFGDIFRDRGFPVLLPQPPAITPVDVSPAFTPEIISEPIRTPTSPPPPASFGERRCC